MTSSTTKPQLDGENLLAEITKHVLIVMLRVSWPKLAYRISDAIVEIKVDGDANPKEIAEEFRSNPQWQLMPAEWKKKLVNLEGRARTLLANASIRFATKGMCVLPIARAHNVFRQLRVMRTEMNRYRDAFVADYENILNDLQGSLSEGMYKQVKDRLPAATTMARNFEIVWAIIPAGDNVPIKQEHLDCFEGVVDIAEGISDFHDTDILHDARKAIEELRSAKSEALKNESADDLINEAHEQMQQFTREMLENMSREPRRVLMEATDNLLEALSDPKRSIRNGTIGQVQEAFEMVKGFEFLADDDLLAAIQNCNHRLDGTTPQTLNSDSRVGERLAEALQSVREQAADAGAAANAVRQFRGIRIRKPVTT